MTSGRLLLTLVVLAAALTQAGAAPLDADACAKLQREQAQLEDAGVEKDMAKGPAWAKANLAPEKLLLVQRFIELEEQLLFRCRNKAIVHLAPETEGPATGNRAGQDKDDDDKAKVSKAAKAPAAQAKGAEPKQKSEARKKAAVPKKQDSRGAKKPAADAAARQAPELSAEPGVTAIEKRPSRAKVDDAYEVPPPDPAINPFAEQLKLPARD